MPKLIDEFGAAARRWCVAVGNHADTNLAFWVITRTGGAWYVKRIGGTPLESFPEKERASVNIGQIEGHYTLDQALDFLTDLNVQGHVMETLLVPGLVAAIDAELDSLAEDYTKARNRAREQAALLRQQADDPAYIANLSEIAKRLGSDPPTREGLLKVAGFMEEMGKSDIVEQAERVRQRQLWRHEMETVTAPPRLVEAYSDELDEIAQRNGWPRIGRRKHGEDDPQPPRP